MTLLRNVDDMVLTQSIFIRLINRNTLLMWIFNNIEYGLHEGWIINKSH
jgi:hypothetical protein